jgi:hypothetical protein
VQDEVEESTGSEGMKSRGVRGTRKKKKSKGKRNPYNRLPPGKQQVRGLPVKTHPPREPDLNPLLEAYIFIELP